MTAENLKIKDIAKALKVAPSTVCRALQGRHNISETTRKKIEDYATKHHYRPNLFAQSLQKKKTRYIGVMVSSIPNMFFSQVINGIESATNENNYFSIISQTNESYEQEVKKLENLEWRSIDGLLVSLSSETEDLTHFKKLQEEGIPIVFFDRVTDTIKTHTVSVDNKGGAYNCTKQLIEKGHTRIAHITSPPRLSITNERLAGYVDALKENNMPVNSDYTKYCAHGGKDSMEIEIAFNELMALPEPPDAIFTGSDRITMECLNLAQIWKEKTSQPMTIAGFSNFDMPGILHNNVITVKQPAFEMGKLATELLLELIDKKNKSGQKYFDKIVLPTNLISNHSMRKNN